MPIVPSTEIDALIAEIDAEPAQDRASKGYDGTDSGVLSIRVRKFSGLYDIHLSMTFGDARCMPNADSDAAKTECLADLKALAIAENADSEPYKA